MTRTRPERPGPARSHTKIQLATKKLTNAERCKAYRMKIAADPVLGQLAKERDRERAQTNRKRPKTPVQLEHQRMLHRQRQQRYEEKLRQKKAAEQASGTSSRPQTRPIKLSFSLQAVSLRSTMARKPLERQKLIIDVDTGIDDAHAIILALSSPSVDVVAITCANGNVKIDDVTANTLRVLQVCDRMDIPVYKGAARSLLGKASEYKNFNSPAWNVPVDNSILQSEHAANALVRLTKQYPGEISLVSLAPLTNIALALSLDPEFPERLRDVIIMGGNTDGRGRVTPCAEFNFFGDPEAAHVVLSSMQNICILPFDTCCQVNLSWDFMTEWTGAGTRKSDFLRDSLEFDVRSAKQTGRQGYRTCDGYAMAAVINPSVITKEETAYATVELSGQLTRGQMVVDWSGTLKKDKNVSLIMGLDLAKIQSLFRTMI